MSNLATLRARLANIREKSESTMGYGLQAAETFGAATAAGYANTRWGDNGEWQIKGVPVDLLAGLALGLGGAMGSFGKHSDHAVNIGSGFLAGYGYRLGVHTASNAT
jgi:hypothetical protein